MASILKAPSGDSKGVVVFTTQERDRVIKAEAKAGEALRSLKARWLIGLHHNWHDYDFEYDDLFDFSMAGEGDLVERTGREFPLVTLDACNFVPAAFGAPGGDQFWDVLYVARPVFFKGFHEFFSSVRALYDSGHRARVLCICPMPPYREEDEETVFYGVRDHYEELFDEDERKTFTLLTLDYDYPFPLDLATLAHFYRSSKVFAHFAPDERRCRVAAYAWTAGIPVVAMEAVGSLLPERLREPPYFYEVPAYDRFHERIIEAIEAPPADFAEARRCFLESDTREELVGQLGRHFPDAGLGATDGWALEGLDIRLGRHHGLAGASSNQVPDSVANLIRTLGDDEARVQAVVASSDPESLLAERPGGPLRRLARSIGGRR
jgi:glycosyltransferase involved in cell wall biosynthesis